MVIAIGGVSNSGKSALAGILKESLGSDKLRVICQDDFVFPEDKIPKINDHVDWEIPGSINFDAFRKTVIQAAKTSEYVIAEGFMVFRDKQLIPYFDFSVFLKISKRTFLKRKAKDGRWGLEPDWYIRHIWDSFLKYGQPPQDLPVHKITAEKEFPDFNPIIKQIRAH